MSQSSSADVCALLSSQDLRMEFRSCDKVFIYGWGKCSRCCLHEFSKLHRWWRPSHMIESLGGKNKSEDFEWSDWLKKERCEEVHTDRGVWILSYLNNSDTTHTHISAPSPDELLLLKVGWVRESNTGTESSQCPSLAGLCVRSQWEQMSALSCVWKAEFMQGPLKTQWVGAQVTLQSGTSK